MSASIGGIDCYAAYKANSETNIVTTVDMVIPWVADGIMFTVTSKYIMLDMSTQQGQFRV